MCAIIDANVAAEVFGNAAQNTNQAGGEFLNWLNRGRGKLVIGGELRRELERTSFRHWANQASLAGILRDIDDSLVEVKTREVAHNANLQSNDPHIIALAQVSGARLLYSNDEALHEDFKSPRLINHPRGKVYSTRQGNDFNEAHKKLLDNKNLCKTAS